MNDDDRVFELARTSRVPILPILGFAFMGLFGYLAAKDPVVPWLFMTGFSMVGTGIAFAVAVGSEGAHRLTVKRAGLLLEGVDKSSVTLPRDAVDRVAAHPVEVTTRNNNRTTTSVYWHLFLFKKDGGSLDLCVPPSREAADQLAADISAALAKPFEGAPKEGEALAIPEDPVAILRESKMVVASREESTIGGQDYRSAPKDGSLTLTWSLRPTLLNVVPGVLAPLGMALGTYAVGRDHFSAVPMGMCYVMLGIEAILILRFFWLLGLSQAVRVTAKELFIEERRGSRVTKRKVYPLSEVSAVDYSYGDNRIGGRLAIRLHGTKPPEAPKDASTTALKEVLAQVSAYAKDTVMVPMGSMKLGDKLRVDLALSAEIARRSGRSDGEV